MVGGLAGTTKTCSKIGLPEMTTWGKGQEKKRREGKNGQKRKGKIEKKKREGKNLK